MARFGAVLRSASHRDLALDACSHSERALDFDPSPECLNSIGQTCQTRAATCVRSAGAVISNGEMQQVILDAERDPYAISVRVLRCVRERLCDGVVGGYLD